MKLWTVVAHASIERLVWAENREDAKRQARDIDDAEWSVDCCDEASDADVTRHRDESVWTGKDWVDVPILAACAENIEGMRIKAEFDAHPKLLEI